MQQDFGRSFEQILSAVEQDEMLKGGGTQDTRTQEQPAEGKAEAPSAEGGLGALLSHPELLSKLPILLRTVQTLSEPVGQPAGKRPETPTALLCALRPYLSESRQRTLDTMIKVSKLTEALRSMQ